jgi:putative FmdB family regulatory protein
MPTYEYECQTCHERLEAVQKFSDAALTTCPKCGGELRKVFSAVGIVFKGSGFYKNDSRSSAKSAAPATSTTTPAPAASTDASSTPAATPSTTSTTTTSTSTSSSD